MIYRCCDSSRRAVLASQTIYNGIDYLEVSDSQTELYLHFFHPIAPGQLQIDNIVICGGERITNIQVTGIVEGSALSPPMVQPECTLASPPAGSNILALTVSQAGDFTTYTLQLVANAFSASGDQQPPPYFDPVYSRIDFSFKVLCPAMFDCEPNPVCPPETPVQPSFSYLAKDYASLRSLMLDRMSTILPAWQERNAADLGIVLVELFAFVGDYLSYQQDAVATEAYLGTARLRTSLRRHCKLVDYPLLDGRNARTWIHFDVSFDYPLAMKANVYGAQPTTAPQQILTQGSDPGPLLAIPSSAYSQALNESPQVFELMENAPLFAAHNAMNLYTWGDRRCCLPAGATSAWLNGSFPDLVPGMVLIFKEVLGPDTGIAADADPTHRCAVRLTAVTPDEDPIGNLFLSPPSPAPLPLTRIEWVTADALPFAVCVSSMTTGAAAAYVDGVSIVLGNNALADCGRTILNEELTTVPQPNSALVPVAAGGCDACVAAATPTPTTIRYYPQLASSPLVFADAYSATDAANVPAAATLALGSRLLQGLLPAITLNTGAGTDTWTAPLDLLSSGANAKQFVAETEDDGTTSLRFGDGTFGKQVIPGDTFYASYRVGGGTVGNVGSDTLCRMASYDPGVVGSGILAISNPLPASGGLDPQSLDSVRGSAPYAFNTQERAVTAADYGTMAVAVDPTLVQARGTFRWTGSWNTVFIAADPEGGGTISAAEKQSIVSGMELYRMAGHDVDVDAPVYVSLEIAMQVCMLPGYLAADVQNAVLQVLSNHALPNGSVGYFAPDKFTFGQPVYLSPLLAAVQQVQGVASVIVGTFQRQGQPTTSGLNTGVIPLQSLEIARLDNDPNFPEHGILTVHVCGGN